MEKSDDIVSILKRCNSRDWIAVEARPGFMETLLSTIWRLVIGQIYVNYMSLVNYMPLDYIVFPLSDYNPYQMVEFVGLSGQVKFDTSGLRTQFQLDLMELQMDGLVKTSH